MIYQTKLGQIDTSNLTILANSPANPDGKVCRVYEDKERGLFFYEEVYLLGG